MVCVQVMPMHTNRCGEFQAHGPEFFAAIGLATR
jgi:hypothetical protein